MANKWTFNDLGQIVDDQARAIKFAELASIRNGLVYDILGNVVPIAVSNADTADRLGGVLAVNAMLVRARIPDAVDLNTYLTTGVYVQQSNLQAASGTNYPVDAAGTLTVTHDGVIGTHEYKHYLDGRIYTRSYYNGGFSEWVLSWDKNTDGSGSGMDADMVDGLEAAQLSRRYDISAQVQQSSYRRSVIALATVTNDNISLASYSSGDLILIRPNGLTKPTRTTVNIQKIYDQTTARGSIVQVGGQFAKLCTFTYNGIRYAGVEYYQTAPENNLVYFHGETNFDIFGLDYWDTQTDTSIITEVSDSLSYDVVGDSSMFVGSDKVWHSGNDGVGSGLDADLVRGLTPAQQPISDSTNTQLNRRMLTDTHTSTTGIMAAAALVTDGGAMRTIINPEGGSFRGSGTGSIKIGLPGSKNNVMYIITLAVYDYGTRRNYKVMLSGYPYSATDSWINTTATIVGNDTADIALSVRFGHDGVRDAIYIGPTTKSYTSASLVIESVSCSLVGGIVTQSTGWSIGLTSTVPTYTGDAVITAKKIGHDSELFAGKTISDFILGGVTNIKDITTTRYVESGRGSGGVAMTVNDGQGNANLTFNHRGGTPDSDGSSARIAVSVDTNTPVMKFELASAVSAGVNVDTASIMELTPGGLSILGKEVLTTADNIPTVLSQGTDLSTVTTPGVYVTSTALHSDSPPDSLSATMVVYGHPTYITQKITAERSEYFRTSNNGGDVFTEWMTGTETDEAVAKFDTKKDKQIVSKLVGGMWNACYMIMNGLLYTSVGKEPRSGEVYYAGYQQTLSGRGRSGYLGDTGLDNFRRANLPGLPDTAIVVDCGSSGAGVGWALCDNGWLFTTGTNTAGSMGTGTNITYGVFVLVLVDCSKVWKPNSQQFDSTGREPLLVQRNDGYTYYAGADAYGQSGLGTATDHHSFTQLTWLGINAKLVSVGLFVGLYQKSDGTIWSSGRDANNVLFNGSVFTRADGVAISTAVDVTANVGGPTAGDVVYHTMYMNYQTTTAIDPIYNFHPHACILRRTADGTTSLFTVGDSTWGQIGNSVAHPAYGAELTPYLVTLPGNIKQLSRMGGAVCSYFALLENGDLYAWGHDNQGQLGSGLIQVGLSTPTLVLTGVQSLLVDQLQQYFLPYNTYMFVMKNNQVWTTGRGTEVGYMGMGIQTGNVPWGPIHLELPPGETPVHIANLCSHSVGKAYMLITTKNRAYTWGNGNEGNFITREYIAGTNLHRLKPIPTALPEGETS